MQPPKSSKDLLFAASYWSGLNTAFRVLSGRSGGIISFHNVLPTGDLGTDVVYDQDVSVETFRRQIEYLTDSWRVRDIAEIRDLPQDGFFISFDDAMLNNFQVVAPILAEFGVTAMFAVCGALAAKTIPHVWKDHLYLILRERRGGHIRLPFDNYESTRAVTNDNVSAVLSELREWIYQRREREIYGFVEEFCSMNGMSYTSLDFRPLRFQPMDADLLKNLHNAGHLIVPHGWTHHPLSFLSEDDVRDELEKSKKFVEEVTACEADVLVYPYGGPKEVDARVMHLARECGFSMAFSNVHWDLAGPRGYHVPRFSLQGQTAVPHLHSIISGLKHFVTKRKKWGRLQGSTK